MRQTTGELYRPVFIDLDELAAAGELIGGRTLAELREEDH
jgi:hypothetical protein